MRSEAWSSEPRVLADAVELQTPLKLRFRREGTQIDPLMKSQVKQPKTAKAKAKAKVIRKNTKQKL